MVSLTSAGLWPITHTFISLSVVTLNESATDLLKFLSFVFSGSGFAVSIQRFFERPKAKFKLQVERGYQESVFLSGLVTREELEPRANNCTKVRQL